MNLLLSGFCLAATVVATDSSGVAVSSAKTNRVAKITAASTFYDAKEGMAYFSGKVCVDDEKYQLHADRACVFMDNTGTNDLKKIVAVGDVAVTNETKRAYGGKALYNREAGMVVLYAAPEDGYCEVRDEKCDPAQVVRGSKIKFWLGSEQIQVEQAVIHAPVSGSGVEDLKSLTGEK